MAADAQAAIAFSATFCHKAAFIEPPGWLGLPWRFVLLNAAMTGPRGGVPAPGA